MANNINMKQALCYIAGLGLILGLIVHVVSLFDIYIGDKLPYIWIFHAGIFIVWIPVIFEFKKNSNFRTRMKPSEFFRSIFKDTPKPVMVISIVFFLYAIINFILSLQVSGGGIPDLMDGKYVIHNHGSVIKELTETEYLKMKANEIRSFSGLWMAFYGLAMGIFWHKGTKEK